MSGRVEVSQAKRSTATSGTAVRRRKSPEPPENRTGPGLDADPAIRPGMRRFSPRRRDLTEEGMAYGMLVEEQRAKLGMTRNELAARIGTPPTTIASIEEGYLPTAKIRNQLVVALNGEPSSQIRRAASEPSPRGRLRRPRLPVGAGWFLGGLPILSILIAGGLAVGAMLVGGQLSGGDGAPPVQLSVSSGLGPQASIHRARVQAQKAAAAEARRAAEKRVERAAAAAAAAAAGNAAAKEAHRDAPTQTQPVTQPVAPSPAPSGGGGGGGGGSSGSGDAPSLQHGIGAGG